MWMESIWRGRREWVSRNVDVPVLILHISCVVCRVRFEACAFLQVQPSVLRCIQDPSVDVVQTPKRTLLETNGES